MHYGLYRGAPGRGSVARGDCGKPALFQVLYGENVCTGDGGYDWKVYSAAKAGAGGKTVSGNKHTDC